MKNLYLRILFKYSYEGEYVSNNYPPSHELHKSGVIQPLNKDGSVSVVDYKGDISVRFANISALKSCLKKRLYQILVARY